MWLLFREYMKQVHGVTPFDGDKDSNRIWWSDGGVHQNLTFPVQADPISGQHCWHQKVSVTKAPRTLSYGDVFVDSEKAQKDYEEEKHVSPAGGRSACFFLQHTVAPDSHHRSHTAPNSHHRTTHFHTWESP